MPMDRGTLDLQLRNLGDGTKWWDRRELRDLPHILAADEQVLAIARGKIARVRVVHRAWLIVVTDQRLLCLRSAGEPAWRQVEVPASQINRVSLRVGPFRGRVVVGAGDRTYRLLVPRSDAYRLLSALSALATPANPGVSGFGPVLLVRRVMDHVLALPAAALEPGGGPPRQVLAAPLSEEADQRIQSLEDDVAELRQQIAFLEKLLADRHTDSHAVGAGNAPPQG